jgi:pyruvate ferredoxin oxidoreductase alpha subunit
VYDFTFLAFKVGEDKRIQMPVWVNYDGFEVSHTTVINKVLNEAGIKKVRDWLGIYDRPCSMLNIEHPHSTGGLVLPNYFMEVKYAILQAMQNVPKVMTEAAKFYSENFWPVHSFVEGYELEDAEYAIVTMGSRFGTVKEAVRLARANGEKVGALRIISFRPFPVEQIRTMLGNKKAVAVLDRSAVYGSAMPPLCGDIASSLANLPTVPRTRSFVDSMGGRVLTIEQVFKIIESLKHPEKWEMDTRSTWIGVEKGDTI